MDPDGNFTSEGKVEFTFKAVATDHDDLKKKIYLHAEKLIIEDDMVTVTDANRDPVDIVGYEYDHDKQFYVIHLGEAMVQDMNYDVVITYTAILNDALTGFYRSSYEDENGDTQWLAVTQLENTGARQAFPCMDEPDRKAKFTVHLTHDKSMVARSNMPWQKEDVVGNKVTDTFAESVTMSTYLVACLVADFGYTETNGSNQFSFRVYHRDHKATESALAADVGPKFLDFYEKYFNLTFPLPKMDVAAVPDFGPGAMENWGLVTFKENFLFYNPESSSSHDKEFASLVLSHELSHQWFGNIVTMKWWNDLWLNEGTYLYGNWKQTTSRV